jgi:hypothetical protein
MINHARRHPLITAGANTQQNILFQTFISKYPYVRAL